MNLGMIGAIGGLGQAGINQADDIRKEEVANAEMGRRKNLESWLMQAREEFAVKGEARAEERKNAPLNRFGAKARELAGQEVPVEAPPVTALSGTDASGAKFGFSGDIDKVRKDILALPEGPDKTAALAQLEGQVDSDTAKGMIATKGMTRKRTSDEALDAAMNDTKINDPAAYADFEARIGKPLRDEKKIDASLSNEEKRAALLSRIEDRKSQSDAKRYELDLKRLDIQQGGLDAQNRKIDAYIDKDSGGKAPSGYRFTKDGNLEYIPNGPADPKTKSPSEKPLTEGQSKALLFGSRMQAANEILDTLEKGGRTISTPGANSIAGPVVNLVNPKDGQQLDQAKRDFLNAVLRRESGAVIGESEFESGNKQYFPQVGDKAEVIAQKRNNRLLAQRGILAEVPGEAARVQGVRANDQTAAPAEKTTREPVKDIEGEMRKRGLIK